MKKSTKMKIDHVDIDVLISDPSNARTHDKKNLAAIRGSIKQFDVVEPLIVRKQNNVVIGGNGRLEVLKELGHKTVPVHYVDFDDQKSKALGLALNRTSELAAWDMDVLGSSLQELMEFDFDIGEIGFEEKDLPNFGGKDGLTDEDKIPEEVPPRSKLGDLWILGEHRVLCGDSTKKEDVERLMNGAKADMVFTDPPYGMNLQTDYKESLGDGVRKAKTYSAVIGDDAPFKFADSFAIVQDVKEQFWWGADWYCQQLPSGGAWFVWNKRTSEGLQKMYGNHFELCWSRQRHQREIAEIAWVGAFGHNKKDDGAKKVHPTMKPVKLIEWFFERFKGDKVIDLFLGSGSTLIACEKTNRKCYGMEIDPKYVDVIVERWEKYTGKQASLA
jgi:DNA modification methylase